MSAAVDEAAAALAYATLNDPTQPPPPFAPERHAAYLKRVAADAGALEYALTEYMRVSGVYWGLTAMRLLGRDAAAELGGPALVELARGCQNADGGFGGARGHDSHVLYTLSALQVLALLGAATYAFLRQLNEDTILFPNLPIPDWVVASVPFILALALRALAWTYRLALPHWARKTEYFFFQKSERIEV